MRIVSGGHAALGGDLLVRAAGEQDRRHHDDRPRPEPRPPGDHIADPGRSQLDEGLGDLAEAVGLVDEARQPGQLGIVGGVPAATAGEHDHHIRERGAPAGESGERLTGAVAEDAGDVVGARRRAPVEPQRRPAPGDGGQRLAEGPGGFGGQPDHERQGDQPGGAARDRAFDRGGQRLSGTVELAGLDGVPELRRQPARETPERLAAPGLSGGDEQGDRRRLRRVHRVAFRASHARRTLRHSSGSTPVTRVNRSPHSASSISRSIA